jgi:hypothetical protein
VGATGLVLDADDWFVGSGMRVERHVDGGTGATGQLSALGFGVGQRSAPTQLWAAAECAGGGIRVTC